MPIPVGEEADAAGAKELPPLAGQVPDAVPVVPPSKVESDAPVLVEPDMPVFVLPIPVDVRELEPPAPEQDVAVDDVLVVNPSGEVPDGLRPGDESSVAPRGIPVGATADAGPMPSGDVMPSGEGPGATPTCAEAGPQPRRAAAAAAIAKRVMGQVLPFALEFVGQPEK